MSPKDEAHGLIERLSESDLAVVNRMLRGLAHPEGEVPAGRLSRDERRARLRAFRGSAAHLPGSVDEFLRERHEENERQEARRAHRLTIPAEQEAA